MGSVEEASTACKIRARFLFYFSLSALQDVLGNEMQRNNARAILRL